MWCDGVQLSCYGDESAVVVVALLVVVWAGRVLFVTLWVVPTTFRKVVAAAAARCGEQDGDADDCH